MSSSPGFTRNINWPLKNLYYQVETLVFQILLKSIIPWRIIVGRNSDKWIKDIIFLKNLSVNFRNELWECRISKISINIFLISNVTSTNILSEISENIGANWSDISRALKLDKRIGKYAYLKPGLGISEVI